MTRFVEALGDRHGLADAKTEAPRGFLLQGTGGKRRSRAARAWFFGDVGDAVIGSNDTLEPLLGVINSLQLAT